jgi:hypothetical protein
MNVNSGLHIKLTAKYTKNAKRKANEILQFFRGLRAFRS